jgi:hypothetical protein
MRRPFLDLMMAAVPRDNDAGSTTPVNITEQADYTGSFEEIACDTSA